MIEPNLTLPYLTKSLFTIPTQIEKWDDPEPISTLYFGEETDKIFRLRPNNKYERSLKPEPPWSVKSDPPVRN